MLLFATNNTYKLREVSDIIGKEFRIYSLADLKIFSEIPETSDTIEENASQKAHFIYDILRKTHPSPLPLVFADDSGLEIDWLGGRPGIHSARYAGDHCNFDDNIEKVLAELHGSANRNAHFITVISLIANDKEKQFRGVVNGKILKERRGTGGFGYDPIFQPQSMNMTYAQMSSLKKSHMSHRALAIRKMCGWLLRNYQVTR